jgi:hypothetical protein
MICGMNSKARGPVITKEILVKRWGIGLNMAHRTLTAMTQSGIRHILHPVERCYKTRQSHLHFPTLNTKFYTNTMFSMMKSIRGNKCAQVFTNGLGYDLFYPLKKESEVGDALNKVIWSIGSIPTGLISDGAKAETAGHFAKVTSKYRVKQRTTEPYSRWQNRAEASIREIKHGIKRATLRSKSPKQLWDFCGEWVAAIRRLTAHDISGLHDRVPSEAIEGNTPDISGYAQFDWYEYVCVVASLFLSKCIDHFVANELRWKMKYLVWEDEFRWRRNNNNSPAMWYRRTSIHCVVAHISVTSSFLSMTSFVSHDKTNVPKSRVQYFETKRKSLVSRAQYFGPCVRTSQPHTLSNIAVASCYLLSAAIYHVRYLAWIVPCTTPLSVLEF